MPESMLSLPRSAETAGGRLTPHFAICNLQNTTLLAF